MLVEDDIEPFMIFPFPGDNVGDFLVYASTVRTAQRTWPSIYYLMPSDKFWSPKEVIIQTPKKNYTVNDYQELMNDLKYPIGWDMRKVVKDVVYDLKAPGRLPRQHKYQQPVQIRLQLQRKPLCLKLIGLTFH